MPPTLFPVLLSRGGRAEEVAEVFPELVAYTADGQPETVFYHLLPAMLLNELERQHRETEALRHQLRTDRADVEARLAELAERPAERQPTPVLVDGHARPPSVPEPATPVP